MVCSPSRGDVIGTLAAVTDAILRLHGIAALALVFLIPALEASAFVGFVFPGEIAVLLGGVLAFQGRAPLWAVIVAAVLGAAIGDSIGYAVGNAMNMGQTLAAQAASAVGLSWLE